MRLIDRDALLSAYDAAHKGPPGGARKLIEQAPTIDVVPLDKLCEWLAGNRIEIPCKCCKYYLGDAKCSAINDMTKHCPNTADEWRYVLTKWMEEQDAAD